MEHGRELADRVFYNVIRTCVEIEQFGWQIQRIEIDAEPMARARFKARTAAMYPTKHVLRWHPRPEHAPVAWVGDNRRDAFGMADALDHIFRSAAAGYVVIGSDLGGYLNLDDQDFSHAIPHDTEVFNRWVAMGAMTEL